VTILGWQTRQSSQKRIVVSFVLDGRIDEIVVLVVSFVQYGRIDGRIDGMVFGYVFPLF